MGYPRNDFDPDGDELSIQSVDAATNGTVEINLDGNVVYTPDSGFIGEDTLSTPLPMVMRQIRPLYG